MSNTNFRLESFRPWNPFQDKAQSLRDSPGNCRYPSPISITTTPSSSNASDQGAKGQDIRSHNSERHSLPARPEVCLNGHPEAQTARQEGLDQATSPTKGSNELNSADDLQAQYISGADEVYLTILEENISPGDGHQVYGSGLEDSEPVLLAGQHAEAVDSGSFEETRELSNTETIDPAILNHYDSPDAGHAHATECIAGSAAGPDENFEEPSRTRSKASPSQHRRRNPKRKMSENCQSSKTTKSSIVAKRQTKKSSGRHRMGSFLAVRSQFENLSVEDRLQFLSWLFEGALSHCVSTPPGADPYSSSRCISKPGIEATYDCDSMSSNTELADAQYTPSTRKGLSWSLGERQFPVTGEAPRTTESRLAGGGTMLFRKDPWKEQRFYTGILVHDAQTTPTIFQAKHIKWSSFFIRKPFASESLHRV